ASGVGVRIVPHGYTVPSSFPFQVGFLSDSAGPTPIFASTGVKVPTESRITSSARTTWNRPGKRSRKRQAKYWLSVQPSMYDSSGRGTGRRVVSAYAD